MAVSSGGNHTLAIKRDGTLWAWGWNWFGQLGLDDTTDVHVPTRVGGKNDWVAVRGGFQHTLGLQKGGTLWAWGSNNYGELGRGDTNWKYVPALITEETASPSPAL